MKDNTRLFTMVLASSVLLNTGMVFADQGKENQEVIDLVHMEQIEQKPSKEELLNPNIPMPMEHQDYLYLMCERKNLDFLKTLAIIRHESSFNHLNANNSTFGYMQIHKMHHARLAKDHNTAVAPLNPYININWGTSMLANLYRTFEKEGLSGEKLDRAVLSSYNKGEFGYRRTGEATKFINRNKEHLNWIKSQYN